MNEKDNKDSMSAPARADMSQMDSLHGAMARAFAAELERCEKEGIAPSPQILSQARQFLQDNGVNVPAANRRFDRLKGQIPNMDELEKSGNVVPLTR
jgi:dihydropteroate synthase